MKELDLKRLFDDYENYKATNINSEFISYQTLIDAITELKLPNSSIEKIGKSIEERDIFRIQIGRGKTKILLWSQMHGDEPTATAALFDLLKFFSFNDFYEEIRKSILTELEIHIIPMLNPDGAERYQRENAIGIDLNRDTLRLECSESKILWDYAKKLKPEFGFNLHDQNSYYTAGRINKSSAISLLAPPMDYVKSINYTREKSMQVILKISEILSQFIPGHVARYSDDFEPRAFGDNFMKMGISSILIESGFYPDDFNKDFVRKLNFISLITAFNSILEKDHEKLFYADYFEIPENKELLFDLLLKNLVMSYNSKSFKVDVGINKKKFLDPLTKSLLYEARIAAIGDLSTFWGIEEHDLSSYEISSQEQIKIDSRMDFDLMKDQNVVYKLINGKLTSVIH